MNEQTPTGYPAEPPHDTAHRAAPKLGLLERFSNSRICGYCGFNFGEVVEIAVCDHCEQEEQARRDQQGEHTRMARKARQREAWAKLAGTFSQADPEKLPSQSMRDLLEKWKPGLRFGVTITGSGTGKSWLLWLLLRKAHEHGRAFEVRDATEMRGAIMALSRNGESTPAIKKLVGVPILAIDDFGMANPTAASDELWSQILKLRTAKGRATIIASPYGGGPLIDRFHDRTAGTSIVKALGTSHAWLLDTTTERLYPPS